MKNIIDYGSLKVDPVIFSLTQFFESDAPGALSWLNLESMDLSSDNLSRKEVEQSSTTFPCAAAKLNKQIIPCEFQCARCKADQKTQ